MDARGAIACSTTGGGFDLVFPETGKVATIHTLTPWCGQQVREPDRGPAWSPDGTRFAFVAEGGVEKHTLLAVCEVERRAVTMLGMNVALPFEVAWSPR